jgi:hypothetical protein
MNIGRAPESRNVWPYVIWPPIAFNIGALMLVSIMYIRIYTQANGIVPAHFQLEYGQLQLAISALVFALEWFFALILILRYRRSGESIRRLISRDDKPFRFRWGAAILMFFAVNAIWLVYIALLARQMPELNYRDLNGWQIFLLLLLTPATAAFTEELIWRGHILTGFDLRGKKRWAALAISSVSFALIHGVFFPDKLLFTFLIGLILGYYYQRERVLFPLMITHWVMDIWSFGIFYFR